MPQEQMYVVMTGTIPRAGFTNGGQPDNDGQAAAGRFVTQLAMSGVDDPPATAEKNALSIIAIDLNPPA